MDNSRIERELRSDRKGKMFIKDEADIASRVGGAE